MFAYEPEPTNFGLLQRNIETNGFQNRARAFRKGVAGSAKTMRLYVTGENSGTNSMYRAVGTPIDVECTTLDAIFEENNITTCIYLKVDCEGAEYDVLLNASQGTLQKIDRIVLEWHVVDGHSPEELEAFLTTCGFAVSRHPTRRVLIATRRAH